MTVLMTPEMANFSGNVHGGTILKLHPGFDILVYGALEAHGSSSAPVVFTAFADDEFGGYSSVESWTHFMPMEPAMSRKCLSG